MRFPNRILTTAPAMLLALGCAKGSSVTGDASGTQGDGGGSADASCGNLCDQDGDGVPDMMDKCPNTMPGAVVNKVGCADAQLTAVLEPTFPPLRPHVDTHGDLGRAGGLTWTYTGIQRGDLFHIYWILCDDPATPCGLSLDGPIDMATENWQFSAVESDLPSGKLVLTNTTHILLADATTPALNGRLTVTITDANNAAIPFANITALVVTRTGTNGAEIAGTGFKVVALEEVEDSTATWTPALDYYDAAATPPATTDAGGNVYTSFGGSFYDK